MTVGIKHFNTVIIGGGQAGIATSYHLKQHGISHIVLEKNRIAERWRSVRWDSLVANGPAWHDRFPNLKFEDYADDDFVPKQRIADYFVEYVQKFELPIQQGSCVQQVIRNTESTGFVVTTADGVYTCHHIVAATGPFQHPSIPPIVPEDSGLYQCHSADYKNPDQLPDGAVLVVGAGSSGAQIADDLNRAGKTVYLSIGAHNRPVRYYRGRDLCWWLGVLGIWHQPQLPPEAAHLASPATGDHGKNGTVDFRKLAHQGIILVGATNTFDGNSIYFKDTLQQDIATGDAHYLAMLDAIDAHIDSYNLHLPEHPEARHIPDDPECLKHPILQLDTKQNHLQSIIWATGFKYDFSWLQVDAFTKDDTPDHYRGVSKCAGVYFVGLPFLSCIGSNFIWGVWYDAQHIANQIALQNKYMQWECT